MFPLLAVALALAPAPTVKLPSLAQLTRAAAGSDDVEMERVAARFGAIKLQRIAEQGKRDERLAALRGLAVVDDGWYTLPDLVRVLADADADVAEAAGKAVRQIAAGLSPEAMFNGEIPRDVPARAATALQETARRAELRPPVRAAAISALASLRPVTKLDEAALARFLSDSDPQVRHAAADALPTSAEGPLTQALRDPALEVAAAAAAALCRDVPATGNKGAAYERANRLPPPVRERLRQLAADEAVALVDRLDLLGCLRVNLQPPDQKLLDQLAHAKLEPLKRRARSLGGR